ncbi:MAG: gamma carbonic anhydrase family protein [Legionellales bacterium]|nr:gamma carbonic anhydrase family protein [Legionellales bacterium]
MTHLSQSPTIPTSCYVHPSAQIIGDVTLGERCSIWPQAVVRGDVNAIVIGNETNVQDGCVLHVTHAGPYHPDGYALRIGSQVTMGHRVVLHGCQIADQCLIGIGCIVMDGVQVGTHSILGAGCLIPPNKQLPPGYVWTGQPAKRLRPLTEAEIIFLTYSAERYVQLAQQYRDRDEE